MADYTRNKFLLSSGRKKIVCPRVNRYVYKTTPLIKKLHFRRPKIKNCLEKKFCRDSNQRKKGCRLEKTITTPQKRNGQPLRGIWFFQATNFFSSESHHKIFSNIIQRQLFISGLGNCKFFHEWGFPNIPASSWLNYFFLAHEDGKTFFSV